MRCGLPNVSISGPALFRSIEKWTPCLIIDEADTALVDNDDLRAVINSGWTRGDGVIRCDPDSREPMLYSTFAPKAVGMKGRKLPDTTLSRCIIVAMRPRRPNERGRADRGLQSPRQSSIRPIAQPAHEMGERQGCCPGQEQAGGSARFSQSTSRQLAAAVRDCRAGGCRMEKGGLEGCPGGRGHPRAFDPSLGIQVLADIRDAFTALRSDRATSGVLISELVADEGKPWATLIEASP